MPAISDERVVHEFFREISQVLEKWSQEPVRVDLPRPTIIRATGGRTGRGHRFALAAVLTGDDQVIRRFYEGIRAWSGQDIGPPPEAGSQAPAPATERRA